MPRQWMRMEGVSMYDSSTIPSANSRIPMVRLAAVESVTRAYLPAYIHESGVDAEWIRGGCTDAAIQGDRLKNRGTGSSHDGHQSPYRYSSVCAEGMHGVGGGR